MSRRTLALALTTLLVGVSAGWWVAPGPRLPEVTTPHEVTAPDGLVVRVAALRRRDGAWTVAHRSAARVAPGVDVSIAFPSGVKLTLPEAWPVASLGGPRVRAPAPEHLQRISFSYQLAGDAEWLSTSADSRAKGAHGTASSTTGTATPRGVVSLLRAARLSRRTPAPHLEDEVLVLAVVDEDGDPREAWDVDDWTARVVQNVARHPSETDPMRAGEWTRTGADLAALAAALAPPESAATLAHIAAFDPESVHGGLVHARSRPLTAAAAVLCGASPEETGLSTDRLEEGAAALATVLGMSPWHWHVGSPDPDAREFAAEHVRASVLTPSAARDVLAQGAHVPDDIRERARAVVATVAEWEGRGSPASLAMTALMLVCLPILLLLSHRHARWFPVFAAWIVPAGFVVASVPLTSSAWIESPSLGCVFAAIGVGVAGSGAPGSWRARAVAAFVVAALLFGAEHVTGSTILDAFANAAGCAAVVCTLYLARDLAPPAEAVDPRVPRRPRSVALRDVGRLLVFGLASLAILLPVGWGISGGHMPPLGVIVLVAGLLALVVALFVWWRPLLDPVLRAPVTARSAARIPRRLLVVAWLLATSHVAAIVATVLATRAGEAPPRALLGASGVAGFLAAILAVMTAVRFVLAAHDRRQAESLRQLRDDVRTPDRPAPG